MTSEGQHSFILHLGEINVLPKREGKVFHNPSHWRNIQAPVPVFSKRYACDTVHLDPFNIDFSFIKNNC